MMRTLGLRDPGAWRPVMWGLIAVALVVPLVAMQFTTEVAWTAYDFAVAAALLVGAGAVFELLARRITSTPGRLAAGALVLLVVALIWAQGAVGVF